MSLDGYGDGNGDPSYKRFSLDLVIQTIANRLLRNCNYVEMF